MFYLTSCGLLRVWSVNLCVICRTHAISHIMYLPLMLLPLLKIQWFTESPSIWSLLCFNEIKRRWWWLLDWGISQGWGGEFEDCRLAHSERTKVCKIICLFVFVYLICNLLLMCICFQFFFYKNIHPCSWVFAPVFSRYIDCSPSAQVF